MKLPYWLGLLLAASVMPAVAQTTFIVPTMLQPQDEAVVEFFSPWTSKIAAESQGTLVMDLRYGMTIATFHNIYDRVMDDVVQIGWVTQGTQGGQFPLSEVIGLPFGGDNAEQDSVALWRLYATGSLADEYKDVKVLAVGTYAPSIMHLAKAPSRSLDDLAGLKMRTSSKIQSDLAARLGGTAIAMPAPDLYVALQRGTVDGALMGWSAFFPLKLHEVARYHIVNVRLGSNTNLFFMAPRKFASLPEVARRAIDKNSGEEWSRVWGRLADRRNDDSKNNVLAIPGHIRAELTASQQAAWQERLKPATAAWVQSHPKGEQVLTRYHAILADLRAGR